MLSHAQRTEFRDRGVLALRGFIPKKAAAHARDAVLGELERLKVRVGGKWHTRVLDGLPTFQVAGRLAQGIQSHPAFDALFPRELQALTESLAGARLTPSQPHPSVLVTPPQKGPWAVPHLGWHVDLSKPGEGLAGVQAFVLADDIAPRGGATMVLAGSHQASGAGLHQALRADALFRGLFDERAPQREKLLEPNALGDLQLQVVELSGRAGDAYLMDMRVLHASSLNSSRSARIALTQRYLRP